MKHIAFAAVVAAGIAGSSGAMALEQSAHTTITLPNGVIVSTSQASFDPATGAFSRSGTATLPNGGKLSFAVTGACSVEASACSFAGTASGPLGGSWTFEGDAERTAEALALTADVTAPNGRTFRIERTSSGDMPRLGRLLNP